MTQPITLVFLGPPGSGKGTQAQVLAEEWQIPHISTGDILRAAIANQTPLGQQAKAYMDQGDLVPDDLVLALIQDRLSQSDTLNGWILDGFPRNVSQATFLDQLLEAIQQQLHRVISLEVPDDIIVTRLLSRGRQDDNEETIRNRLIVYQQQTAPLINYYQKQGKLTTIDGNRQPEQVAQSLKEVINP